MKCAADQSCCRHQHSARNINGEQKPQTDPYHLKDVFLGYLVGVCGQFHKCWQQLYQICDSSEWSHWFQIESMNTVFTDHHSHPHHLPPAARNPCNILLTCWCFPAVKWLIRMQKLQVCNEWKHEQTNSMCSTMYIYSVEVCRYCCIPALWMSTVCN